MHCNAQSRNHCMCSSGYRHTADISTPRDADFHFPSHAVKKFLCKSTEPSPAHDRFTELRTDCSELY